MLQAVTERQSVCTGKLLLIWGVYGYAMASLAAMVRGAGGSDAISWVLALGIGLALAIGLGRA